MEDCIFCKIARGEIPCSKVYEDQHVLAFRDINPQAPTHVVVIPKRHVANLNELEQLSPEEQLALPRACAEAARLEGIRESGYRIVSNCGDDACQSVHHLHIHVLGGGKLSDKMG